MPRHCVAVGCDTKSGMGYRLHRFPKTRAEKEMGRGKEVTAFLNTSKTIVSLQRVFAIIVKGVVLNF